ncbi:hypothetical protein NC652_029394 [Populus alba x Populus x berolinensis]|nr:hypothetical protein NC652_029394 [Populus alba x Populus x berolinensis]
MQTEVDVISQEWETAQGKRKSPGSGDLNTQKSKDIARAPQGWKQRGQEGALDGVKIRSAHKGVATRAFGSGLGFEDTVAAAFQWTPLSH